MRSSLLILAAAALLTATGTAQAVSANIHGPAMLTPIPSVESVTPSLIAESKARFRRWAIRGCSAMHRSSVFPRRFRRVEHQPNLGRFQQPQMQCLQDPQMQY